MSKGMTEEQYQALKQMAQEIATPRFLDGVERSARTYNLLPHKRIEDAINFAGIAALAIPVLTAELQRKNAEIKRLRGESEAAPHE